MNFKVKKKAETFGRLPGRFVILDGYKISNILSSGRGN